jgi:hypothetical protein
MKYQNIGRVKSLYNETVKYFSIKFFVIFTATIECNCLFSTDRWSTWSTPANTSTSNIRVRRCPSETSENFGSSTRNPFYESLFRPKKLSSVTLHRIRDKILSKTYKQIFCIDIVTKYYRIPWPKSIPTHFGLVETKPLDPTPPEWYG